jgi:hypothetical protein
MYSLLIEDNCGHILYAIILFNAANNKHSAHRNTVTILYLLTLTLLANCTRHITKNFLLEYI